MKRMILTLAALTLAGAAALQPLPAAAHVVVKEFDCQSWNDGKEMRCLFDDAKYPTATIVVKNTSTTETIAFQADEYHSICRFSSGQLDSSAHVLAPGSQETLKVLSPGADITCREIFIVSCTANGVSQNCTKNLKAVGQTWKGNKQ
jgi:hypothetical protein